jgi:polygalacturonase
MYLQVGCHNAVIRNCTSENNRGNSGIQLNATGGGITNVLVERCILRGNAQGFSQMGVIDSTFRHNVAYNNGFDGPRRSGMRELIMWTSRKDGTKCRGSLWENNTFVNTVPEGHKLSRLVRSKSGTSNITFRNNIFVCRGKRLFNLQSYEGFVFENNCLYNIGGGIQVEGAGKLKEFCKAKGLKESGTLTADPMFADISEGNLRLKEGSPCIDAGAKTDAETGVKGRAPDIGAYEYGSDIRIGCLLAWRKSNAD